MLCVAYIKNHYEPKGCPGTKGCLHCCPIGRKRDGKGCFTCECKRSGNFEGDIQIKCLLFDINLDKFD